MRLTATFDADNALDVLINIAKDDGSQCQKVVSFEDFFQVLKEENDTRDCKIARLGKLPYGFIDGGVTEGDMEAIIHIPSGVRPLMYYEQSYVVPWPDLVFYFRTAKGAITHSKLYALDGAPTPKKELKYYPFGNVHQDGRICWGGNVLPKMEVLKDFDKVVTLFFGAGTNDDLYKKFVLKEGRKKRELMQRELLEILKGMDKFPSKCLATTGMTFAQL